MAKKKKNKDSSKKKKKKKKSKKSTQTNSKSKKKSSKSSDSKSTSSKKNKDSSNKKKKKKSKSGKKTTSKKEDSEKTVTISLQNFPLDKLGSRLTNLWKSFKSNKVLFNVVMWLIVFFVSLIIVDFGVQYLNYHASAAVVNGERIYKREFYDKLEQNYGKTVVSQMIDEKLIRQEAAKNDVKVDEEDIDNEIKQLEKDYGGKDKLDEQLDVNGTSREQLKDQIETVLMVQEMLGDEIEITEKEKKDFFKEYKDVLFTDKEDPTYEESEEKIVEILTEQKVSQELQPWLAEVKDDANIQNNVDQPKKYKLLRITKAFVNDVLENSLPEEKEESEDK